MTDLRERLAALEHEQWEQWSRTVAEQGLTPERIERWQRYWVPYADLDEPTKDFDREWADKVLAIIETDRARSTPSDREPTTEARWMNESRRYDLLVVAANLMQRWRDMPSDLFEQDQAQNTRLRRERDKWLGDYERHARKEAEARATRAEPPGLDVETLFEAIANVTGQRWDGKAIAAEYARLAGAPTERDA